MIKDGVFTIGSSVTAIFCRHTQASLKLADSCTATIVAIAAQAQHLLSMSWQGFAATGNLMHINCM